jgi:hypothetical protein
MALTDWKSAIILPGADATTVYFNNEFSTQFPEPPPDDLDDISFFSDLSSPDSMINPKIDDSNGSVVLNGAEAYSVTSKYSVNIGARPGINSSSSSSSS